MNKLMNVLFGAEMHASAKEIRGKKSQGVEDQGSYKNWRERKSNGTHDVN